MGIWVKAKRRRVGNSVLLPLFIGASTPIINGCLGRIGKRKPLPLLELLASNTGKGRIKNSPPSLAIGEHTIVLFLCSNKTPTGSVPTEVEGMPINVCQTKIQ